VAHVAIQGLIGGKNVNWMEPITDDPYGR